MKKPSSQPPFWNGLPTLQEALREALLTITAHDALGWFTHCGYRLPSSSISQ